ncbi:MAG TPA: hypothetical protein VLC09_19900 [Polyangiaceae bacterium]|nr:hypothetical protein [Polyangiaceae bacterium]
MFGSLAFARFAVAPLAIAALASAESVALGAEPVAAEPTTTEPVAPVAAEPTTAEPVTAEPTTPGAEPTSDDGSAESELDALRERSWSGRPLVRSGFHFHADLGLGSGDSSAGLYHSMEIGGSVGQYTISLLHSFIQYRNVFEAEPFPHEIGGFFLQLRGPLVLSDLSWKFAAGVGGTIDQTDGFVAHPGFGLHYGVDMHLPIWTDFAATLSVAALTVEDRGNVYFGAAAALGVSVF